jgi:hypothetical protein
LHIVGSLTAAPSNILVLLFVQEISCSCEDVQAPADPNLVLARFPDNQS